MLTSIYFTYASEKVGQQGDPFSNVEVFVVKPVESGEAGREERRDPSPQKILFAINFLHFEAHLSRALFGGEVLGRDRWLLLIIVNFYLLYVTPLYFRCASAEVAQKGDPFSDVAAVVVRPVESDKASRKR